MEDRNGDYERLGENSRFEVNGDVVPPKPRNGKRWKRIVKWIVLGTLLGILGIVVLKWIGPLFMNKVMVPFIRWETETFSPRSRAILIFASMVVFPIVLLPSTPSMWLAGMTFGYGIGFLLVMAGVTVGVTLPYFIGSLFRNQINNGYLENYPQQASILRLAGQGNWFHQFQAIALIRVSPFPYPIFNYAVVATDVDYCPYLLGSMVGIVPDVLFALYSGMLIRSLADVSQDPADHPALQMILKVAGFCLAVAATVLIGIYTKRRLDQLRERELME
ncbi:hypothetical protein LWI28_017507 [Acer negundo]|uniref:VTT domain-containing protein n=1 Tax=Acer negundo TaxID=4023 RepID=A0AAD5J156_ACENE|nr:hypothetical protein LWI28_017507 [Acer negundo]KAK4847905.1 hypothetical protein QYF36_007038 [Acer negundo]